MPKLFVLDTSVLVHDPYAFKTFANQIVVIPINVLDEIDKLKTFPNEVGKNARVFIRALDAITKQGEIHKGIKIENNITLKIDTSTQQTRAGQDESYVDNKILACASALKNKRNPVVIVSRDFNLRVRANAFELLSEDYEKDKTAVSDLYVGFQEFVNEEIGLLLKNKGEVSISLCEDLKSLLPNECVHFIDDDGKGLAIGRKIGNRIKIVQNRNPWGLDMRNKEQAFAADLICDPKLSLVSLIGQAGTGKSLCALACALDQVLEKKMYNKLIVYRPIEVVGKEMGFLPGSADEKMAPFFAAIDDSLEFLFTGKNNKKGNQLNWRERLSMQYGDRINFEAISYIRGRSIPNALILLDEAQNISKEEIKTLLTRASSGTKIILTGDISQIDNNKLDATNNGLTHAVEKMKHLDFTGHITFSKGERSILAQSAAELL